ncbi:MAG: hydroxymethylbilane synthase [Lachnospiraceae bacterium]
MTTIRIGTRKSSLAMVQTNLVAEAIRRQNADIRIEIVPMSTKGDEILDRPLLSFGGKGAFITEFEKALLDGTIDLAVHSAKDLPMELAPGLAIMAVPEREDARDALVVRKENIPEKDQKIRIGTGSARRKIQILRRYPLGEVVNIRGNINTRLEQLKSGELDGIVLAMAGLKRLDLYPSTEYAVLPFPCEEFIPAGGQGILAVEGRQGDPIGKLIQGITHRDTLYCLETEREILRLLGAGCNDPYGVYSSITGEAMTLWLMLESKGKMAISSLRGDSYQRKELAEKIVTG